MDILVDVSFWLDELYKYISPPILEKFLRKEESKSDKFVIVVPCIKLEYEHSIPAYISTH